MVEGCNILLLQAGNILLLFGGNDLLLNFCLLFNPRGVRSPVNMLHIDLHWYLHFITILDLVNHPRHPHTRGDIERNKMKNYLNANTKLKICQPGMVISDRSLMPNTVMDTASIKSIAMIVSILLL